MVSGFQALAPFLGQGGRGLHLDSPKPPKRPKHEKLTSDPKP